MCGIPIAHKDLFETKGVRTTAGSLLYDDYMPDDNAAIVQQLEDAGAVLLGKTNTHELGGGVTTINPFFGTTRNPVDRTRIPGGSSGGSAAAVVAHLCAAATGSDTGGSVRIPAALCGCVGFKPTFGRISTRGLLGACPTFDHVGFLTRTVEDAQIISRVSAATPRSTATGEARVSPSRASSSSTISSPRVAVARSIRSSRSIPTSTSPSTRRRWRASSIRSFSFEIWGRLRRRLADQSGIVFESNSPSSSRRRGRRSPNTKPASPR